jgi:hypothetical protein
MNKDKLVEMLLSAILEGKNEDSHCSDLFEEGKKYFVRTVTYHAVGICKEIREGFLLLDEAMWVADSGRLSDALKEGFNKIDSSELEPFNGILHININSIVDFVEYKPKLIVIQK